MVKCSKDGCSRDAPKLCGLGRCGTCCQPRCHETVHGHRGTARGRPGRPKERKWHDAWNASVEHVQKYMAEPGAVKFMEAHRLSPQSVFDAMFKYLVADFQRTTSPVPQDPENLPLCEQFATLTCILHPAELERAKSLMEVIPREIQMEPPGASPGHHRHLPASSSSSSSQPIPSASASSSQVLKPDSSSPDKSHLQEWCEIRRTWTETLSPAEALEWANATDWTGQLVRDRPWDHLPLDPSIRVWKEFKMSEPGTPLPPQTQELIPKTKQNGVADEVNTMGTPPRDEVGMMTRHWQRASPPLYDTNPKVCRQFAKFLTDTPNYDVQMLCDWLKKRDLAWERR